MTESLASELKWAKVLQANPAILINVASRYLFTTYRRFDGLGIQLEIPDIILLLLIPRLARGNLSWRRIDSSWSLGKSWYQQ